MAHDNTAGCGTEHEELEYCFVDDVEADYNCIICGKLFVEPHLTECCGQHYCKACLDNWMTSGLSNTCPQCRSPTVTHILDRTLERRIRELRVYCNNTSHGCSWVGSLCNLQQHLSKCPSALLKCSNGCGTVMARRDMDIHENKLCGLRLVACEFCAQTFAFNSNHASTCPQQPITCEKCRKMVTREKIQSHLEKECKETSLNDLAGDVSKLLAEITDLKRELTTFRQERQELKAELGSTKEKVAYATDVVDSLKAESKRLRSTLLQELDFLNINPQIHEQLALECIKTQLKHRVIFLKPCGDATFRIFPYSRYKLGKTWYSPPFCLSDGYQFCIAIHLYGIGAGQSTHVSLCLHQMRGKHDTDLKWPFLLRADFEVRLLNQVPKSDSPYASQRKRLAAMSHDKQSPDTTPRMKKTFSLPGHGHTPLYDLEYWNAQVQVKEILRVSESLSPVTAHSKVGPLVSSLDLFCLQSTVDSIQYRDSLVLQLCLLSLN